MFKRKKKWIVKVVVSRAVSAHTHTHSTIHHLRIQCTTQQQQQQNVCVKKSSREPIKKMRQNKKKNAYTKIYTHTSICPIQCAYANTFTWSFFFSLCLPLVSNTNKYTYTNTNKQTNLSKIIDEKNETTNEQQKKAFFFVQW